MIMTPFDQDYDCIVMGGGPAGATAAALLAEKGKRVLIIEKRSFPRYCIGESLLPYCYFPLQRLGMIEKMNAAGFVKKYSVQFVSMRGNKSQPFYFFQHMDHPAMQTWQVVRSKFDRMLLDNAIEKGATVSTPMMVKQVLVEGGTVVGVDAAGEDGTARQFRAKMVIDATGRDAVAIRQFDWRIKDPQLNKVAVWTYFRGGKRDEGYDEGATTVAYIPSKGWFWYIPLPDDVISVGVTGDAAHLFKDSKEPADVLHQHIDENAWLVDHLRDAEQFGEYWATGDYSYRSKHSACDGLVLVGDAFAFLDPVFSSGVFLALRSGELAADAVNEAIDAGDVSAERFNEYSEIMCGGIEAMRKLVYAFYDESFRFSDVLKKHPELRGDLTDCLIGNVERDFDALFGAVAEFADIPEPLAHGRPRIAAQSG